MNDSGTHLHGYCHGQVGYQQYCARSLLKKWRDEVRLAVEEKQQNGIEQGKIAYGYKCLDEIAAVRLSFHRF